MKVLLINLSLRPDSDQCIFPIGLGYIATAIDNAGFDMELLDIDINKYDYGQTRDILKTKQFDVVAFGCIVTGYTIVKWISKTIKEINPKAVIICGNSVASSIPNILLDNTDVDIVIDGEGERAIIHVLTELKIFNHHKHDVYTFPVIKDINRIPSINWDLFDMDTYIIRNRESISKPLPVPYEELRAMPVNSARGCLFKCTFCYQAFYGQPYRYRSKEVLEAEIIKLKEKYNINYITFYDDLTLFSKRRAEEFIAMLTGKGIYWTACCRGNLFTRQDHDLLKRLKDSGCVSLGYSLESADENILKAMNKKLKLEEFAEQKKALDEVGIATVTSIVIGYPQETEESLKKTYDFCYDNGIYPSTGYLQPQPGTPMYEYAKKYGYILDEEEYLMRMGDRQDLRLNMSRIPTDKLEPLVFEHLKRIRDKLKLPLKDDELIKTGVVRGR